MLQLLERIFKTIVIGMILVIFSLSGLFSTVDAQEDSEKAKKLEMLPEFAHNNVKTGFNLPNGMELPFWHVMFENLEINASRE